MNRLKWTCKLACKDIYRAIDIHGSGKEMTEQIVTDALFSSPITYDVEITGKLFLVCRTYRRLIISPFFLRRLSKRYEYSYEEGVTTFIELLTQISREHYTCYSRFFRGMNWLYDRCPVEERPSLRETGLVDTATHSNDAFEYGYTNYPGAFELDNNVEVVNGLIAGGHQATLKAYGCTTVSEEEQQDTQSMCYALYSLDMDFIRYIFEERIIPNSPHDFSPMPPALGRSHTAERKGYLTLKLLKEMTQYVATRESFVRETVYLVVTAHDSVECWEYLESNYPQWTNNKLMCCTRHSASKIFTHMLTPESREDIGRKLATMIGTPLEFIAIYKRVYGEAPKV